MVRALALQLTESCLHPGVNPPISPYPAFFASAKTYLQNGLCQLITCGQSHGAPTWPNHTHSLASFQWSGCPYKARGVVPEPVCANKVRNGPASADQGFSTASQGSCHVHGTPGWTHPPPPIPPFFLAQNLSSKRIAPSDNMRPKSDASLVIKGLAH